MFDAFLAEFLILFLLTISCLRIFFVQNARIDIAAIIPIIAMILSILLLLAWNIDISILVILILSFTVCMTNMRALFRFCAHLYVDHYSILFRILTFFELICVLLTLGTIFYFRPVQYNEKDFDAFRKREQLTGSIQAGFKTTTNIFDRNNGFLYTYTSNKQVKESSPILLFISDKRSTVLQYEPYFFLLAKNNYTILAADLYPSDITWFSTFEDNRIFRRFYAIYLALNNPNYFSVFENSSQKKQELEYKTLINLGLSRYGSNCKFFIINDSLNSSILNNITTDFPGNIIGNFSLTEIPEYKTPGYGFLEQTDPILGIFFGTNRDPSLFIPRYAANKTVATIHAINEVYTVENRGIK